jgi:hypothetical protein
MSSRAARMALTDFVDPSGAATPSLDSRCRSAAVSGAVLRSRCTHALNQRHHSAPKLHGVAGIDLVRPDKSEFAIGSDVVGR